MEVEWSEGWQEGVPDRVYILDKGSEVLMSTGCSWNKKIGPGGLLEDYQEQKVLCFSLEGHMAYLLLVKQPGAEGQGGTGDKVSRPF